MQQHNLLKLILLTSLATTASTAFAHTGLGTTHSFLQGFSHPWQGFDHLLVMFAIGLFASRLAGYGRWLLPAAFLGWMSVGAGAHFAGLVLPYAEQGVIGSVLLCAAALWLNRGKAIMAAGGLITLFAVFHGYVHAAEIDPQAGEFNYALGFLISTALLHGLGLATGLVNEKFTARLQVLVSMLCAATGWYLISGAAI